MANLTSFNTALNLTYFEVIKAVATLRDYSAEVPANGYRSLLTITEEANAAGSDTM